MCAHLTVRSISEVCKSQVLVICSIPSPNPLVGYCPSTHPPTHPSFAPAAPHPTPVLPLQLLI
jgi:hypothetical protein